MPDFATTVQVLSILGAVIAFAWGIVQFTLTQRQQVETRRIEATKPFLERQLTLYTEVTRLASHIATSKDGDREAALSRFWELYWGELAFVEDAPVEAAMVKLGSLLEQRSDDVVIKQGALDLARACRNSLAKSWGVASWQSPH